MLQPSPHPFAFPAQRPPAHRLALGAAAIGVALAVSALFLPSGDAIVTDVLVARVLPFGLFLIFAVLAGLLARLLRADA